MSALAGRARAAIRSLGELPLPGSGRTAERFAALRSVGAEDLSLARLVEPHVDAVAILAEAGRVAEPGRLYAVWASASSCPPRLEATGVEGFRMDGRQPFGGGATLCDSALVAVEQPVAPSQAGPSQAGDLLIEVDLLTGRDDRTIDADPSGWRTHAFGRTGTSDVTFRRHEVTAARIVARPGWYLDRPGFWHGALGPAAVWAGGAEGLVSVAQELGGADAHRRAGIGEMRALVWSMAAQLDVAGHEIDEHPDDVRSGRVRALTVRHLIERQCTRVLDLFGRTVGARPLAFDDAVIARVQELQLYIRQVHHGDDLEELGASPGAVPPDRTGSS